MDTSLREGLDLGFEVVAHEIELLVANFVRGVNSDLGWRQGEEQPAMTRIHKPHSEDVSQEGAVCLGILALNDNVSA